jgi:trk system potassium uptake protein TrkA
MADKFPIGVIGLGKFGSKFGQSLVELGWQVIGIDIETGKIKKAQPLFSYVYQADASNKEALEQIGVPDLKLVLVSVGDAIAASCMISMYLKEFAIPMVWVKAINDDHEKLLLKVGADKVIIPEHMAAEQLANRIAVPGFIEYLPFDPDMVLEELKINKWAGATLREIELPKRFNVQVIALKKPGDIRFRFVPRADDLLEKDDRIIIVGPGDRLHDLDP